MKGDASMKKRWKLIFGILILIALAVYGVLEYTKPLEAELLEIKPQTISKSFKEEGLVIAGTEKQIYTVSGGKITSLPVSEGNKVTKGNLLVSFDSKELSYQIQQLQGNIRSIQAQQNLEVLTVDRGSKELLFEAGIISKKEYENAINQLDSDYYPALIDTIKSQIDLINFKISQTKCYAPVSGIISELLVEDGMVVAPGAAIMTIFNENSPKVEVYVLTEDASKISNGMDVDIIQNNKSGDILFKGKVEKIASSAVEKLSALGLSEQRLKITISPDIPKDMQLKPGYALDIQFTTDKLEDQIVVPKTTLFPYKDGDALWVVREGLAVIQPVKQIFENDRNAAITGINKNELVIINPKLEGLKETRKITPK